MIKLGRRTAACVVAFLLGLVVLSATAPAYAAVGHSPAYGGAARRPRGDWSHVMWTISQLVASPPQAPAVYLLGGSSARECIVSDADWSAAISAHVGRPVAAYDFGTSNETFGQMEQIVLHLPHVQSLVFIGVSQSRFDLGWADASVTLPPPSAAEPPHAQHLYGPASVWRPAKKRAVARAWLVSNYGHFRARYDANYAVLERILQDCASRPWLHPVLVETPRDMAAIGRAWDVVLRKYHRGCRTLSSTNGVPYLDFVRAAHLANADFADLCHLVESGRPKFQGLLTQHAAQLLSANHLT